MEAKSIYAFNCDGGGYVIASADSRALPVLGYSDTGSIEWERMPENMRVWLKLYDEAIATLGNRQDFKDGDITDPASHSGTLRQTRTIERAPIEPLIKTNWYQISHVSCHLIWINLIIHRRRQTGSAIVWICSTDLRINTAVHWKRSMLFVPARKRGWLFLSGLRKHWMSWEPDGASRKRSSVTNVLS